MKCDLWNDDCDVTLNNDEYDMNIVNVTPFYNYYEDMRHKSKKYYILRMVMMMMALISRWWWWWG